MRWAELAVVVAAFLLAYTWVAYPTLLWLLWRLQARPIARGAFIPRVSIIVPAHNEQARIAGKLDDCLRLDYPAERVEVLVVSDNSTDATESIVAEYAAADPRVRLLRCAGRVGKSAAQNQAAARAAGEILFFTDANTRAEPAALRHMVANFADPQVGLVSATVRFRQPGDAIGQGQGAYWRYELVLRQLESDLGILATASGQALALRREVFLPLPPFYGDDCVLPLHARLAGYRVMHEPRAVVYDTMPHTVEGEFRARMRMTARNWTGTLSQAAALLNPLRFPGTAWGLVSHKLLRWLTPFFLLVLFAGSAALAVHSAAALALWLAQVAFYAAALLGWLRVRAARPASVFAAPFAFCLANAGFLCGLLKCLRNERIVAY